MCVSRQNIRGEQKERKKEIRGRETQKRRTHTVRQAEEMSKTEILRLRISSPTLIRSLNRDRSTTSSLHISQAVQKAIE